MSLSIRSRILLYLALPMIILYTALQVSQLRQTEAEATGRAEERLMASLREHAGRLDASLREVQSIAHGNARFMTHNPQMRLEDIHDILSDTVREAPEIFGAGIAFVPDGHPEVEGLCAPYVYRDKGTLVRLDLGSGGYAYTDGTWEWWEKPVRSGQAELTAPYADPAASGTQLVTYSVPFFRDAQLLGVAGVDLKLQALGRKWIPPAETADDYFIVGHDGHYVYHPDPQRAGEPDAAVELDATYRGEANRDSIMAQLLASQSGIVKVVDRQSGEPMWLLHVAIPSVEWTMVARLQARQIAAGVRASTLRATVALAALIVFSLLSVWYVSRLITRPLVKLNQSVTQVASQRLGNARQTDGCDEVAILSTTFTDLALRLADKEAELSAMLGNLPGLAYRYMRNGMEWRLALINEGCRELTGYPPEAFLEGRVSLRDLIHELDRPLVENAIRGCLESGETWSLTYRIVRADGTHCWVYEQGTADRGNQNASSVYDGFLIDISERKEAEEQVQYREEVESLIASISAGFIHSRPGHIAETLTTSLRSMGVFVGVDHVFLMRLEEATHLHLTQEWCSAAASSRMESWVDIAVELMPYTHHLLFNGDFLHVPDTGKAPVEASVDRQFWKANGITAILAVPVLSRGRAIGMLGLDTVSGPRPWSVELITMVRIVAEVIGSALARQTSEDALRQTQERFELVTRVASVYDLDLVTQTCWWTGLDRLLGLEMKEARASWLFSQVHPSEREQVETALAELHRGQQRYWDSEYRLARADGSYAYVHDEGQLIYDKQGTLIRMVGVLVDVSQLRAAVEAKERSEQESRIKAQVARLSQETQGLNDLEQLLQTVIADLAKLVGAGHGAFYLVHEDPETEAPTELEMLGSYARDGAAQRGRRLSLGETLVGQCVLDRAPIELREVPADYLGVRSGLGAATPGCVLILPVPVEERIVAVMELATLHGFSGFHRELLDQTIAMLGAVIVRISARQRTESLLAESQRLANELAEQQKELKASNERLQEQTRRLRESEEELRVQQEELEASNKELEEKTHFLQEQTEAVSRTNRELAQARNALVKKASELELANHYKSEFLANMSHELRTPLNSLLLLARQLAENVEQNLSEAQRESAAIIYSSGNDLLSLINELLDLAKIEAGRMELYLESVECQELAESMQRQFRHLYAEKKLELQVELAPGLPESFCTDRKRLEQVMRNLLSNAIKFTERGKVTLRFSPYRGEQLLAQSELAQRPLLVISVSDSGVGIPPDKFNAIFEAFQQADGSTSRKYGGTGLGLSICREIAIMLQGEIHVASELGQGSTFTVLLPMDMTPSDGPISARRPSTESMKAASQRVAPPAAPLPAPPALTTAPPKPTAVPRHKGSALVLIIEDDINFARVLQRECRQRGMSSVHCTSGEEALERAAKGDIDAVISDIRLPGIDGWETMRRLRENPVTAGLPVHVMSVGEEMEMAQQSTAVTYLVKPVNREALNAMLEQIQSTGRTAVRTCLIVEDQREQREDLRVLLEQHGIAIREAATGKAAFEVLDAETLDCMVLDLTLPDMSGFQLLAELHGRYGERTPAVVVYTARDLTREESQRLQRYAQSIIVKSPMARERLIDEIDSFLERTLVLTETPLPPLTPPVQPPDRQLQDRRILIVDDDMRSLFSLARILRQHGADVEKAESAAKALELLQNDPRPEVIVTDIMMPDMDGLAFIRRLRDLGGLANSHVIALTARTMPTDREACLEAGASDFLTKPLNEDDLLATLTRVLALPIAEAAS